MSAVRHEAIVAKAGVAGSGLDQEYVMLDPGPGVYYGLNAVGTSVWHFIQEPRRIEAIVDHVCARFEVTRERCAEDVQRLIDTLAARGLVEFVDAPAAETPPPDAR